jgi:hypothetical protein
MLKLFFPLAGLILFATLLGADADAPIDFLPDHLSEASSPWVDLLGDVKLEAAPEIGEPACTADFAGCRATETFSADFLLSVIRLPLPSDVTQLLAQPATAAAPAQEFSGAWLWISALMAIALAAGRALRVPRNKA